MKRCPKCGIRQGIAGFYANPGRHDGLAGWCIPCENAAGRAVKDRLYSQVVAHLGGRCARCGYATPGPALQVDHVHGDGAEHRKATRNWNARLRAALADNEGRFQLLCANCNQIKRMEDSEHVGRRTYVRLPPRGTAEKRCARCEQVKPAAQFHSNAARTDGLSVYCAICMVARTKGDLAAQRAAALEHLGGRCQTCGFREDVRALQIDHVAGGGHLARVADKVHSGRLYAVVIADTAGAFQCLCANCNILKRVANGEHRPKTTYVRNPATERRPTRKYLSEAEIREVIRLVQEEGLTQREAGARFGITQTTVSQHIRRRSRTQ